MAAGHTGSTLLDLILGSHPLAFSLGELQIVTKQVHNTAEGFPHICGVCAQECEFWNRKVSLPVLQSYFGWKSYNRLTSALYWRFGSFICDIYEHLFEWSGADVLIDSSKEVWWIRRQLKPFWFWRKTTPFLIHLCRDGRAVTASYLRKYPKRGIVSIGCRYS